MPSLDGPAARLERYLRALLDENRRINLTAIRDLDAARVLHVQDSLALAQLELAPRRCLDLGTGNGFPGVAVRALYPVAELVLLDRTQKKLQAIGRVLGQTDLLDSGDIELCHADASQLRGLRPEWVGAFDLVTARAVGTPAKVAALAEPLLTPAGSLVLWLDAVTEAPEGLGDLGLDREVDYELPEPAARRRRLAVYTN